MDEYIDCFKQGPVVSKLWLCEQLEKILVDLNYTNPTVHILGGWVNVLGFMFQVRKPNYYKSINSYDMDSESTRLSDQLCDAWRFGDSLVNNRTVDATTLEFDNVGELVFTNCSVDQFEGTSWYDNIPIGSVVCLQTTTLPILNSPWHISQETKDMDEFKDRYKLTTILYQGEKEFPISDTTFTRLMLIGIK
jgi:hypothetical protein